jgi:hypothetical protein
MRRTTAVACIRSARTVGSSKEAPAIAAAIERGALAAVAHLELGSSPGKGALVATSSRVEPRVPGDGQESGAHGRMLASSSPVPAMTSEAGARSPME